MWHNNTVGDFIGSVFSGLVNRDGEVFRALFANPERTGAVETVFNEIEKTRDAWCNGSDVYGQTGEMLEKSLSFFSVLRRLFREGDDSFKSRNELLFYRGGDTVWGDRWNIEKMFRAYFGTQSVFLVNNTGTAEENLLEDGDFERKDAWTLENCVYDSEARFSERTGVLFASVPELAGKTGTKEGSASSCRQTVGVRPDSAYFLHFFAMGLIGVEITDGGGRYWNGRAGEFGEWQDSPYVNSVPEKSEWNPASVLFFTDGTAEKVTVNFTGSAGRTACLDYARLFRKESHSSFTLVVNLGAKYTEETMGMAPGETDPVAGVDYGKMSYIGFSHLLGVDGMRDGSVHMELLEVVRPGGITACVDITTRDLDV